MDLVFCEVFLDLVIKGNGKGVVELFCVVNFFLLYRLV